MTSNIYPWINGPHTIKYGPTPTLNQPLLETPFKNDNSKIIIPKGKYNLYVTNNIVINKKSQHPKTIPWKDANVKSHQCFLLDTRNLTFI
jgi:hypothetical protein